MAIGRTDSMQNLITEMESIYGETIIGSDINLIKHLFYYLKFENIEFPFEYEDRVMTAVVDSLDMNSVTLNVLGFEEQSSRRARIKFEAINVLYVFDIIITEIKESYVSIRIPTELQSAEMRQHRRILVDDLFMNFIILFKSYRGGKYVNGDNINAERQFPFLFREIKKDEPDLKLINLIMTDYILNVSQDYEIIIYKNEKEYSHARYVLNHDKKSIFIKDCNSTESYTENLDHPILTNYRPYYNKLAEEVDEFEASMFFDDLHNKESKNFDVSYIISPISIFDKLVGHIKVYTTAMDRHILTPFHAEYIHEMMEIVSYGFTKQAIKGNNFNVLYTTTTIVDISIAGLLFEIYDEGLFNYLKKHNNIKMYIPISKITLVLSGEILRFYKTEDAFRLGLQFFDSNPGDMKILESFLFDKKLNILSE